VKLVATETCEDILNKSINSWVQGDTKCNGKALDISWGAKCRYTDPPPPVVSVMYRLCTESSENCQVSAYRCKPWDLMRRHNVFPEPAVISVSTAFGEALPRALLLTRAETDGRTDRQPWHFLPPHHSDPRTVIHLWTSNTCARVVAADTENWLRSVAARYTALGNVYLRLGQTICCVAGMLLSENGQFWSRPTNLYSVYFPTACAV
jgi:hypothetical protein